MGFFISFIQIISVVFGCLAALLSILLFVQLSWPSPVLWILKLYASALSRILALIGFLTAIAGLITGSILISVIGMYVFVIYFIHVYRVTRPPDFVTGFEQAFGVNWEHRINAAQSKNFLPSRTILRLPRVPAPNLEQNVTFATIPGTDRKLLCDLWQPNPGTTPSGLAFIYLHGAAWYFLDKDLGTRPFFSHLASQGHVIMDVAYRLAPETDLMGMIHDVKKAIIWMKENATNYRINPGKIVVGGGSSGGHLALMAAYTSGNSQFTPLEFQGIDTSVRAVVSIYGPTDLETMYFHTNQHLTTRSVPGKSPKRVPTQMPEWIKKSMGNDYYRLGMNKGFVNAGSFAPLLGGHPDECPEQYSLFSPVRHVHPGCPPTLLIHGEDDLMAPVKTTHYLHTRLVEEKILTVMHILPQTDHAFDLQLPKISPSAHNAIYDVERFIALMV